MAARWIVCLCANWFYSPSPLLPFFICLVACFFVSFTSVLSLCLSVFLHSSLYYFSFTCRRNSLSASLSVCKVSFRSVHCLPRTFFLHIVYHQSIFSTRFLTILSLSTVLSVASLFNPFSKRFTCIQPRLLYRKVIFSAGSS